MGNYGLHRARICLNRCINERNQVLYDLVVCKVAFITHEHRHHVVTLHLALKSTTFAPLEISSDLIFDRSRVSSHFLEEGLAHLQFRVEENVQRPAKQVTKSPSLSFKRLDFQIKDGFM